MRSLMLPAVAVFGVFFSAPAAAGLLPVRIAVPVNGHIHPSMCVSGRGTIVVTYGRINHRDLRLTTSSDGGGTWTESVPFEHTVDRTYYPGSLTTLADGRIVHAWNRWDTDVTEKEPRSVLYSVSADDGRSWSRPEAFPRDPKVRSIIRHPFVELEPNRWLVSLSDRTFVFNPVTGRAEDFGDGRVHGLVPIVRTPQGTLVSGAGWRSTDAGRTWESIPGFPNLSEQGWRHELVCLRNGLLLASEIIGPGFGGRRIQYVISGDDGESWDSRFVYHDPGRPIIGRACPRTVQLDDEHIGVVFYDLSPDQPGGPGLFFLRIPIRVLTDD